MYQKVLNGKVVDMTPADIALVEEMDRIAREEAAKPKPKSPEERIAELEAGNQELREALELLLSGETEVTQK